jgi:excisionase family DNA binding protein
MTHSALRPQFVQLGMPSGSLLEDNPHIGNDSHGFESDQTEEVRCLPTLVDIEAVAGALGISMRQVRRLVAENRIPYLRIGHLIRFDPVELNRWIDQLRSTVAPKSPETTID